LLLLLVFIGFVWNFWLIECFFWFEYLSFRYLGFFWLVYDQWKYLGLNLILVHANIMLF
jgi:hypothetical protein